MESVAQVDVHAAARESGRRRRRDGYEHELENPGLDEHGRLRLRRWEEYERALERDAANTRLRLDEQGMLRLRERRRDEYEWALERDAMNAQLDEQERLEREQERLEREQEERNDPASLPATLALPLSKVGETREEDCAICLDKFLADRWEKLRTMPCSHSFHQRCIFRWLLIDRRCPICRFAMPSEKQRLLEEEEEEELHGQGAAAGDVGVGSSSPLSYPIYFIFDSNHGGLMPA